MRIRFSSGTTLYMSYMAPGVQIYKYEKSDSNLQDMLRAYSAPAWAPGQGDDH